MHAAGGSPKEIAADALRLLSFRRTRLDLDESWRGFLAFGLLFTWLAGVGRYWDNPRAGLWQTLGLGSVAYVFVLAAILWVFAMPLRPKRWSYGTVLVFVTLTSPPALLYAIPVERLLPLPTAAAVNVWFLAVVAVWRVALLVVFLRRRGGLGAPAVVVGTLLPVVLIVNALAALNLEHVIFRIMAGLQPGEASANDDAYEVLILVTAAADLLAPVLLAAYGWLVYRARRGRPR